MEESNIEEILEFTFSDTTKENLKQAFKNDAQYISAPCEFASFRFLRVNATTINLEFGTSSEFGFSFEVAAQFINDGRIYLPNMFLDTLYYSKNFSVPSMKGIFGFSVLTNALIAAHSVESLLIAKYAEDANETINGLDIEYYKVEEGELNIYAADKYGLDPSNALAISKVVNGKVTIDPTVFYEKEYRNLVDLQLLSIPKLF